MTPDLTDATLPGIWLGDCGSDWIIAWLKLDAKDTCANRRPGSAAGRRRTNSQARTSVAAVG